MTVNLIQAEVSGKASNEGEKGEDGDEQKLESIGGKSEGVLLFFDVITRCLGLDPGSGGSGQEGRDGSQVRQQLPRELVSIFLASCFSDR